MSPKNDKDSCQYPYVVPVRFRTGTKTYSFGSMDADFNKQDIVVVETSRGLELADVAGETYGSDKMSVSLELKPIVRKATTRDIEEYQRNKEQAKAALLQCEKKIAQLKLDMKLVSAEFTLDRSKLIFVYVADERVDFRELLKELTGNFKCRIELRQIGQRDKAKLVGAIGICGQETCCSRFKSNFDVISINMAKTQMLALNTQKLSGQCGKLMCCLKHENDDYKACREGLPKPNDQIQFEGKRYRVNSISCCSDSIRLYDGENYTDVKLSDFKGNYQGKPKHS